MFSDRLNLLMIQLNASGAQIAKYAGFDRTNVSRLRSGARIPVSGGPTAEKLISGIYLFADSNNSLPVLCEITGQPLSASAEEKMAGLSDWLFGGEEKQSPRPERPKKAAACRTFGERLDAAMSLAELSNIRLSQLINVDASLISRYRTGVRTPRANPEMTSRLANVLWNRILKNRKKAELSHMMRFPEAETDEAYFLDWLCDFDAFQQVGISSAEDLLDAFDSYSAETSIALPPLEAMVPPELLQDTRSVYSGISGLQEAVLRFLGNAVLEQPKELWLYSDQNMEWMTSDPVFLNKWACLMSACVSSGIRIRIIHNVDRSLDEMNAAITNWLPLYMSGMIESYFSQKVKDSRFSHTLFLSPGRACIESSHVIGTESVGQYRYYTEDPSLELCRVSFLKLMENAKSLLRINRPGTLEIRGSELTLIQNTLSISTMPEDLVRSFDSPALYEEWTHRSELLHQNLASSRLTECIALPEDESLFQGSAPVEAVPGTEGLCYTPEQYAMHIRNILRLSGQYPSYRFYILPEVPFRNIRLLISEETVTVVRSVSPYLSMSFTHPLMCRAFRSYADQIKERYKEDRDSVRRHLENRFL